LLGSEPSAFCGVVSLEFFEDDDETEEEVFLL